MARGTTQSDKPAAQVLARLAGVSWAALIRVSILCCGLSSAAVPLLLAAGLPGDSASLSVADSAKRLLQARRPNAAACRLESALEAHSVDEATTFSLKTLLAQAYSAADRHGLAAQLLAQLVTQSPASVPLHFQLAQEYGRSGSLDASAKQYLDVLRMQPDNRAALIGLAKTLLQVKRSSEAVFYLQRYILIAPEDAEGYFLLGRAWEELGQEKSAVAMLAQAAHLSPRDSKVLVRFGMALGQLGNFSAALPELESAERLDPDNVPVHSARARILSSIGQKEQAAQESALAQSLTARQHAREQASFYIAEGNALLQRQDFERAENRFRQALDLDPQSAQARSNLGLVLALLHHPEEGRRELEQAIALAPNLALAYNALGLTDLEEGRVGEAASAFKQAIAINPQYAEAKNNLGTLYVKSGDTAQAIALFEQAAEDSPHYPQSYLNWGLVLASEGNVTRAQALLEKALRLSPDLAQARQALYMLQENRK